MLPLSRRPHCLIDMRVIDDAGKTLPHDGKTVGNLQVQGRRWVDWLGGLQHGATGGPWLGLTPGGGSLMRAGSQAAWEWEGQPCRRAAIYCMGLDPGFPLLTPPFRLRVPLCCRLPPPPC